MTELQGNPQTGRKHWQNTSAKGFALLVYEKLSEFNNKDISNQVKNGQNILIDTSPKKKYRGQISIEKMVNMINHRKTKIKTTRKYHYLVE